MHSGAWWLAVLALAPACALAEEGGERPPFHAENPERWGTLKRIVEPTYPPAAIEGKVTGNVDVEGVVTPLQMLEQVTYTPGSPEAAVFIDALKEVLPLWRFYPVIGNDCSPTSRRVTTRIWFEIEQGKPKVSVSHNR